MRNKESNNNMNSYIQNIVTYYTYTSDRRGKTSLEERKKGKENQNTRTGMRKTESVRCSNLSERYITEGTRELLQGGTEPNAFNGDMALSR
jgi:hypothetical protein